MGFVPSFEGLSFEIEVGPVVEGDLVAVPWVGPGP
jgi:hypothetical protein